MKHANKMMLIPSAEATKRPASPQSPSTPTPPTLLYTGPNPPPPQKKKTQKPQWLNYK